MKTSTALKILGVVVIIIAAIVIPTTVVLVHRNQAAADAPSPPPATNAPTPLTSSSSPTKAPTPAPTGPTPPPSPQTQYRAFTYQNDSLSGYGANTELSRDGLTLAIGGSFFQSIAVIHDPFSADSVPEFLPYVQVNEESDFGYNFAISEDGKSIAATFQLNTSSFTAGEVYVQQGAVWERSFRTELPGDYFFGSMPALGGGYGILASGTNVDVVKTIAQNASGGWAAATGASLPDQFRLGNSYAPYFIMPKAGEDTQTYVTYNANDTGIWNVEAYAADFTLAGLTYFYVGDCNPVSFTGGGGFIALGLYCPGNQSSIISLIGPGLVPAGTFEADCYTPTLDSIGTLSVPEPDGIIRRYAPSTWTELPSWNLTAAGDVNITECPSYATVSGDGSRYALGWYGMAVYAESYLG